jgi:hypothetical protein
LIRPPKWLSLDAPASHPARRQEGESEMLEPNPKDDKPIGDGLKPDGKPGEKPDGKPGDKPDWTEKK